ncbi:glycosyltransferase family 4 protein [Candidatus Nitrosocosmicus hydrocola]|uniref:glycosyltransferase family 4 protein n=1 Tax=Candidatus Nitrosocosmicus hydrocola TaxID=1826872 RepID=UPI0011E59257|nr:glycosyltransferase family 4 protein [Candidatus Nitrosocosmicus hydrocola]
MKKLSDAISNKIVLLITLYFPPEIGGGSSGAWNRAMIFHELGYRVIILTAFPSYPLGKINDPKYKNKLFYVENIDLITVVRFRLPSLKHDGYLRPLIIFLSFVFLSLIWLPRVHKVSKRPSIVYARSPVLFASFIGFIYSKIFRSSFIYEVPDLWPEELFYSKAILSHLFKRFGVLLASVSYRFPDKIVTVSKSAEEYIISHYQPKSPVFGIPVGIDLSKFQAVPKKNARDVLVELSLLAPDDLEKFIILYSGRISSAQNIECLLFAADALKNISNMLIYIVGEGPDKKRIEEIKTDKKITNVRIFNAQKREMMPILISAVDIVTVFLSSAPIFSIALPTKFYEYLACSKPIIGICKGELSEIINRNQIGLTCEIGNCEELSQLIKKMNNPSEVNLFERNTNLLAKQFSIHELSLQFKKILSS